MTWAEDRIADGVVDVPSSYFDPPPRAPFFDIPFHHVESEKFTKSNIDLAPYGDILRILTDNSVKDLAMFEDERVLDLIVGLAAKAKG